MKNLRKGDTVGIVAPSAPVSFFCPRRMQRGIEAIERMGYKIKLGNTVDKVEDYSAGTMAERVDDIHNMFLDSKVKAIIATIGGYTANDLLDKLDYELIKRNNNKLFIGYSDITVLLFALMKKSEVQTIMGPMVLPQFGEFPDILNFTKKSFEFVVSNIGTDKEYSLPVSAENTEEMLSWDKEDNRARKMNKNEGWKVVFSGNAEGRLLAGNLNTLSKLVGTEYMIDTDDSILFIEDDDEESASTLQRMLQHFKQAKLLDNVCGIVFGRFQKKSDITEEKLKKLLLNVFGEVNIPIISGVDFGHTDPILSLPMGKNVKISANRKSVSISVSLQ